MGNQRVLYGLRNDHFVLEDVKDEKVADIPRKYESIGNWKGCDMLGFLYSVLLKIEEKVKEGTTCTIWYDTEVDWEFYYIDHSDVFLNTEFKKYANV